jgi:YD repeat-containing protein
MNSDAFCLRCGSAMIDGLCPACETSGAVSSDAVAQPRRPKAFRIWLIVCAVYLVCSVALIVYVGHLLMQRAKVRESWNQAHPAHSLLEVRTASERHEGPVARVDELKGNGRIYLVQMGDHPAPYSLDDFAQWLRSKYALDVQVLPAMTVAQSAWDSDRKQYVAELLYEQIKREHPDLAANPNAHLIGFTDADMHSIRNDWSRSRTQRYWRDAVISANQEMTWYNKEQGKEDANIACKEFQARVRRILLKDVAVLYWHLPANNDPTSLLHNYLDPGIPAEDIYESDLDPARTSSGEAISSPGIFLTYSANKGIKPLPGASIQEYDDEDPNLPDQDESREIFKVSVASGILIDRHIDFSLPDAVPIQFERVTRAGWGGSHPFGISGTDNYDDFLYSNDNIRDYIAHADGSRDELRRVPIWMPFQSFAKYIDTGYSGKYYEMRWRTIPFGHYDLKRYDGEVKTFLPCSDSKLLCYLIGIRNALGQELKFNRDETRRLTQLTSPNGSWLRLSYGPGGHVAEIVDSRGRRVRYGYDGSNRLTTVTYPSGEVFHYEYDDTQHLLTFSVASDAKSEPRALLRNEYDHGRVVKQTLDDGTSYSYKYTVASNGSVIGAVVRTPEGRVFNLEICEGYSDSTVREQTPQPGARERRPDSK